MLSDTCVTVVGTMSLRLIKNTSQSQSLKQEQVSHWPFVVTTLGSKIVWGNSQRFLAKTWTSGTCFQMYSMSGTRHALRATQNLLNPLFGTTFFHPNQMNVGSWLSNSAINALLLDRGVRYSNCPNFPPRRSWPLAGWLISLSPMPWGRRRASDGHHSVQLVVVLLPRHYSTVPVNCIVRFHSVCISLLLQCIVRLWKLIVSFPQQTKRYLQ